MSFQAMAWASTQKTGGPSARGVLFALANHANFTGSTFVSLDRIAEESEQSRASVIRRLAELEELGLIYRVPRRKDAGRHAGEFTSNLYFVLIDQIAISEALRHGYDPAIPRRARDVIAAETDEGDTSAKKQGLGEDTVLQSETRCFVDDNENNGLSDSAGPHGVADCNMVIPGEKADHHASDCNMARVSPVQHEPVTTEPIFPLKSPEPCSAAALDEGSWLGDWERFQNAWVWSEGELPEQARRKFRELTPSDRIAAVEFIPAYLAEVRRKQGKPMKARRWVSFRGWEPFVLAAKKHPTLTPGKSVAVIKNSDAWFAWMRFRGVRSFPTRRQMVNGKSCEVWDFPTLWPPGAARNANPGDESAVLLREFQRI